MGIFKKILNGLGFSQDDENLSSQAENWTPQKTTTAQPIKNQVDNSQKKVNVNSLICYAPKTNDEVKKLIDCIRNGEACIVNLDGMSENDKICTLDYLGGAAYALSATISRLQGNLYVISPNGMNITLM